MNSMPTQSFMRHAGTGQEQRAESRLAGQPGASLMDAETLDAMCHFFLRHTAYAGRGWDAAEDSESVVRMRCRSL